MFKNYIQIAFRSFQRDKVFSFINIIGLTVALTTCLFLLTIVLNDLSFDRSWKKSDNIYRVNTINKMGEGMYNKMDVSFVGLENEFQKYPEVSSVSRIITSKRQLKLSENTSDAINVNVLDADTTMWHLLNFQVLEGNPKKFLIDDNMPNVIISKKFKDTYFPNQNVIGKIIYGVDAYEDKDHPRIITGVVDNSPQNSIFHADIIQINLPYNGVLQNNQSGTFVQHFVLLHAGSNPLTFTNKFNLWYRNFVKVKNPYQIELQPLKDIYLHSEFSNSNTPKGSYQSIVIFSLIAGLILVIAAVNYINLGMAKATKRLKEMGVRRILGAQKRQIAYVFITESLLYFSVSLLLAFIIYVMSLPYLGNLMGRSMQITFFSQWYLFASAIFIIFIISILIGAYPAWALSKINYSIIKNDRVISGKFSLQTFVSKSLVIVQFSLSILVLISLIVIWKQSSFLKNKSLGFDKNNLLAIDFTSFGNHADALKNQLLQNPNVESVALTSWLPSYGAGFMSNEVADPNNPQNNITINYIKGDIDLAKTLGLKLQKGRLLSRDYSMDIVAYDSLMGMDSAGYMQKSRQQSSLITGYTANKLDITQLGKSLTKLGTTPVGIVGDINNESLKKTMQPLFIIADRDIKVGGLLIRVKPGHQRNAEKYIHSVWLHFFPNKPIEIREVSNLLDAQYKVESTLQKVFIYFSILSIVLATMGVFGLVVQSLVQRTKEIGIRKVLGGSNLSIVKLFSFEYLKLLIIAIMLASPIGYVLLKNWLNNYAYRIHLEWWIFASAGLLIILVAVSTVAVQTWKSAITNPVNSLRSE
ncbi:ABC transporter permease [Rhizosphaericola mali]|uniref:FtsX-like permease family protein n=1 Tax=Rhizosphaericola mali TaxID=2545455 RepID=A0A5P2FZX1_9BACT|nr:ABC transporter permease [Rhizosphaericola mali]QES89084.1 FtsX-like permease family protein [Rhizosphaericola mali]